MVTAPPAAFEVRLPPGATCRVIGLGGIGQIVATHLVRFLCSLRPAAGTRVVLIDGDDYEPANEARMRVPAPHQNKAATLAGELAGACDAAGITLLAVPEYVGPGNVDRLVPGGTGESVLLCVDNHATRKLLDDHAATLEDVCLISGGNDGVGRDGGGTFRRGTEGNVQVYIRAGGADRTPRLSACHPEIARPRDRRPDEPGCADALASTPQLLFTNLLAASCMLNAWWLHGCGRLAYWELGFAIHAGQMAPIGRIGSSR